MKDFQFHQIMGFPFEKTFSFHEGGYSLDVHNGNGTVLDQKKSKKGKETPKEDMDVIENRLKRAAQLYKEEYGKKSKKK